METTRNDWLSPEERAHNVMQAKALRHQTQEAGLRCEVYLPPSLAEWLLGLVEQEVCTSPGEALLVILGEHRDLEPHTDLRQE